jgi:hypothetical protein
MSLERHPCWSRAPGAEEGMEAVVLPCSRNAHAGTNECLHFGRCSLDARAFEINRATR